MSKTTILNRRRWRKLLSRRVVIGRVHLKALGHGLAQVPVFSPEAVNIRLKALQYRCQLVHKLGCVAAVVQYILLVCTRREDWHLQLGARERRERVDAGDVLVRQLVRYGSLQCIRDPIAVHVNTRVDQVWPSIVVDVHTGSRHGDSRGRLDTRLQNEATATRTKCGDCW